MPRPPDFAPIIARRRPSPYSTLAERVARRGGEVYRLNVGDTWMEPAPGCRMEDLTVAEHPGMHRYAPIQGIPALREVIAARVVARTGVPTTPAEVLIGAGGPLSPRRLEELFRACEVDPGETGAAGAVMRWVRRVLPSKESSAG